MTNTAAYIFGTGYLYYEAESEPRPRGPPPHEMEAARDPARSCLGTCRQVAARKFEIAAIM
jgi:hypothetical protein